MQNLNEIIENLKQLLQPKQLELNSKFTAPKNPVALIIGAPRSGTTLLMQLLASSGLFSYPTNLLARFAYSPYIGAQVQELLFNQNFGMEKHSTIDFSSDLGKSEGSMGVNEFFHFWRRFIPVFFPSYIEPDEFDKINFTQILQELASIESIFNKPFVCKGIMLQYNLEHLKQWSDKFLFVYIKRNPEFVMQSIFQARQKYFNDTEQWWSVKPKEYVFLKEQNKYQQIAGQVYYTQKAIEKGLDSLSDTQKIIIRYEDLCQNPSNTIASIAQKIGILDKDTSINIPTQFAISESIKIKTSDFEALQSAYKELING